MKTLKGKEYASMPNELFYDHLSGDDNDPIIMESFEADKKLLDEEGVEYNSTVDDCGYPMIYFSDIKILEGKFTFDNDKLDAANDIKKFLITKSSNDSYPEHRIIRAKTINECIAKLLEEDEDAYYAFNITKAADEFEEELAYRNTYHMIDDEIGHLQEENLIDKLKDGFADDGPLYSINILNDDDTFLDIFSHGN